MTPLHSAAGDPGPSRRPALLMITAMENAEALAASLASQLSASVQIASTWAGALRLLDRRAFAVVILDQLFADSDPEGAEMMWQHTRLALPVEINFALAGPERVEREVRAAVNRRQKEEGLAAAAAAAALDRDLKNAITGILLESQLALAEQGVPPQIAGHLRTLAGMAGRLRECIESPATTFGGLPARLV